MIHGTYFHIESCHNPQTRGYNLFACAVQQKIIRYFLMQSFSLSFSFSDLCRIRRIELNGQCCCSLCVPENSLSLFLSLLYNEGFDQGVCGGIKGKLLFYYVQELTVPNSTKRTQSKALGCLVGILGAMLECPGRKFFKANLRNREI